ncbi:hypothetical protein [Streptomyces shenzhenensis]|uniref:hypothetical protein n=1 Tax=Streptomyces shenzhenensis TaxID=943815 RepID=UPI0033D0BE43
MSVTGAASNASDTACVRGQLNTAHRPRRLAATWLATTLAGPGQTVAAASDAVIKLQPPAHVYGLALSTDSGRLYAGLRERIQTYDTTTFEPTVLAATNTDTRTRLRRRPVAAGGRTGDRMLMGRPRLKGMAFSADGSQVAVAAHGTRLLTTDGLSDRPDAYLVPPSARSPSAARESTSRGGRRLHARPAAPTRRLGRLGAAAGARSPTASATVRSA